MSCYNNGMIYTITVGDKIYVGSTRNFNKRKYKHRYSIRNPDSRDGGALLYREIRNNNDNWTMEKLKDYPCNNKKELEEEEEKCRIELNATLNSNSCSGFNKQLWREKNDEKIKANNKLYYQANKQKFWAAKIKNNIYEKVTCQCGCVVTKGNISTHRKSKKHFQLLEEKMIDETV